MADKRTITIQDIAFTVSQPYAEGHVLTGGEAAALNQTWAEAIRNNSAAKVKKAKEAPDFGEAAVANLQREIDEYCSTFKLNGGSARSADPIDKEANLIAAGLLNQLLAEQGVTQKAYRDAGKYDAKLEEIASREDVRKLAASNVKARSKLTLGALNLNAG